MARIDDNIVMKNMSGAIGKQLVFRRVKSGRKKPRTYPEFDICAISQSGSINSVIVAVAAS
jgi:hypothetical protein